MDLLSLLVNIIVVGLIFYILYWVIGKIGLPEPFNKVALVVLALFAAVILIGLLTGHTPMVRMR